MTKTREIELLDTFIATLGTDSYLGPWLKESRSSIVADISRDFAVTVPMPSEARAEGLLIVETAKAQAAEIVRQATERARQLSEQTAQQIRADRERAAHLLDDAAQALRRGHIPSTRF